MIPIDGQDDDDARRGIELSRPMIIALSKLLWYLQTQFKSWRSYGTWYNTKWSQQEVMVQ